MVIVVADLGLLKKRIEIKKLETGNFVVANLGWLIGTPREEENKKK